MVGKTKSLSQINQLLQLLKQGNIIRHIARRLNVFRNKVKAYLVKLSVLKLSIDDLPELEDPELVIKFHAGNPACKDDRLEHLKSHLLNNIWTILRKS